jgi:glycosyltransferase involved in cell wall biosynthesis
MYKDQPTSDIALPLVSVIFRTMNSERFIEEALLSITNQTYRNIEIIVVDNFSMDRTQEKARSSGARVFSKGPERCAQSNFGVEEARGEFVMISDDDMVTDLDYVEKAVKACQENGYDAIYRSVVTRSDTYWGQVRGLERQTYIGDNLIEAAQFFRRAVFLAVGGYDTTVGIVFSDDYDIQAKLDEAGYRTGRIDAVVVHTNEWNSLLDVAKRSFYYGQSALNYLKRQPTRGARQLFPLRAAYIRNWRILVADQVHFLGLIVFKIVQYTSGGLGLLISWMRDGRQNASQAHKSIYGTRK